jgi:hypothetical protein
MRYAPVLAIGEHLQQCSDLLLDSNIFTRE